MQHSRRIRAFYPTSALLACFAASLGVACANSDDVTSLPSNPPADRTEIACKPGTTKLCYDGGEPSMTMRLAVDSSGNLVVAGRISTVPLDFGDGPVALSGGGDVFVAKLSGKGDPIFSKTFGDAGAQQADSVAVDTEGTIYVTGRFDGSIHIGGSQLNSANSPDLFVAKLSAQGEPVWSKGLYGDTDLNYAGDIAVDPNGDILVTGTFAGNMSFDAQTMTSPFNVDSLFMAKFNGSSKAIWAKYVPGQKSAGSLAVDGSGNIFLTGGIDNPMDFGGGAIGEDGEGYITKLDANGGHLWSRAFLLGEGLDKRDFVATTDAAGSMLVATGIFEGIADFGGPPLTSEGQRDIFVARLTP